MRIRGPCLLALAVLAGCGSLTASPSHPPSVLLLGEQHDVPEHQQRQQEAIRGLASQGRLAAVVLEMALRGRSTVGLPPSASEETVRQALQWSEQAWPWASYGPSIMVAVRAGAPVIGTNLEMQEMRNVMGDSSWDERLPAAALQRQREAIRTGHCGLLPDARIAPMTRVQVARDAAMAEAIRSQLRSGKTVVLLAGSGHVDPELGVPRHLPPQLTIEVNVLPQVATGKDYCAQLREQMRARPSS